MSKPTENSYDVIVVGAGLAGSAAAILFGRSGLRVALVERQHDIDAYKKTCTHAIQASARPVLQRLGLETAIEQAGGLPFRLELWTRYGWIRPTANSERREYGTNIRRQKLDPLLRRKAAETPGVDLLLGWAADALLSENGRYSAVVVKNNRWKKQQTLHGRLIVAADGHFSRLAELAGVPQKQRPNNRFSYMAYYQDLPLKSGSNPQIWFLDPAVAYAFPTDDNLTLLTIGPTIDRFAEFKADPVGGLEHSLRGLPDGPDMSRGRRVSEVRGMLKGNIISRPPAVPGLAFIGDAALSSDPLWGVGCGWALQSADWLVTATLPALLGGEKLARGLASYRRRHRLHLAGHRWHIDSYATGRPFYWFERLFYHAASHNPYLADQMIAYGSRQINFPQLARPSNFARSLWTTVKMVIS